jgi:hypothetical protein
VLFMQATSIVLAYISRDTLFVKTFGKDYIPYCILCISAVSGSVLGAYAGCGKKYGLRLVASCSYFVFDAFFCVMRLVIMCVPTGLHCIAFQMNRVLFSLFQENYAQN